MDSVPQRTCKACGNTYPLTPEYWHKDKKAVMGLNYACKECARAKARKQLADNRERNKEVCKAWYEANKAYVKEYRTKNAEYIAEKKREWRKNNPEMVKRHKSESQKRNRESANRRSRRYMQRNPDKVRARTLNRIARKHAADGTYTTTDIEHIYAEQQGRCLYCGMTLHDEYHVDHIIPLSRGGTNWPENLACACPSCNMSKNNHLLHEWEAVRGW